MVGVSSMNYVTSSLSLRVAPVTNGPDRHHRLRMTDRDTGADLEGGNPKRLIVSPDTALLILSTSVRSRSGRKQSQAARRFHLHY